MKRPMGLSVQVKVKQEEDTTHTKKIYCLGMSHVQQYHPSDHNTALDLKNLRKLKKLTRYPQSEADIDYDKIFTHRYK